MTADRAVAAILDIDGTLVDTNYHHAIAWHRALQRHGCTVPLWRLHRHMGMGGDQLVGSVAGDDFEREHGDAVREAEGEEYEKLIGEAQPLEGARALLAALRERDCRVVLASSAKDHEVEHYVGLLDAGGIETTSSGDVGRTKPQPDLVEAALEKVGGPPAFMLGDSVWDCEASQRAGVRCFGVLTGGFSEEELREAGAADVFESLDAVRENLDEILGAV